MIGLLIATGLVLVQDGQSNEALYGGRALKVENKKGILKEDADKLAFYRESLPAKTK